MRVECGVWSMEYGVALSLRGRIERAILCKAVTGEEQYAAAW